MGISGYRRHKVSAEFSVRRFRHRDDFEHVNQWLDERSMPLAPAEELPNVGFIAYKEGQPVAAAFLRNCEGGVGVFDSMITNPKTPLFTRHIAIEILIDKVMIYARENRVRRLLAFTTNDGILRRSKKRGFVQQPHSVISLMLS